MILFGSLIGMELVERLYRFPTRGLLSRVYDNEKDVKVCFLVTHVNMACIVDRVQLPCAALHVIDALDSFHQPVSCILEF